MGHYELPLHVSSTLIEPNTPHNKLYCELLARWIQVSEINQALYWISTSVCLTESNVLTHCMHSQAIKSLFHNCHCSQHNIREGLISCEHQLFHRAIWQYSTKNKLFLLFKN